MDNHHSQLVLTARPQVVKAKPQVLDLALLMGLVGSVWVQTITLLLIERLIVANYLRSQANQQ